jgi:hypothetical protein
MEGGMRSFWDERSVSPVIREYAGSLGPKLKSGRGEAEIESEHIFGDYDKNTPPAIIQGHLLAECNSPNAAVSRMRIAVCLCAIDYFHCICITNP